MITFQLGSNCVVKINSTEVALPPGSWRFERATSVLWGTNSYDVSGLRSGATVTVDNSGISYMEDGPDLYRPFEAGFALVIGALGAVVAVRWFISRIMRVTVGGVGRFDE